MPSISEWWVFDISAKRSGGWRTPSRGTGSRPEAGEPGPSISNPFSPLDQPHLPQRLGAIQALGEDPRREALQLLPAAGGGQRRVAHVVLKAEAGVIDPDRAAAVKRCVGQLVAVARDQMQPPADLLKELLDRRWRAFEDRQSTHVHVRMRSLLVQEGCIHGCQTVEVARGIEDRAYNVDGE